VVSAAVGEVPGQNDKTASELAIEDSLRVV
jgi:hypothetical protein